MSRGRSPSLSRRLLTGLVLVSVAFWGLVAWVAVRDSLKEVYELFDNHLAQTALALVRVADPDETGLSLQIPVTGRSAAPSLLDVLKASPAASDAPATGGMLATLPWRTHATQLEYERHLRYQVWNRDGELVMRSANAAWSPSTQQDGYSESTEADGRIWRHYSLWDTHTMLRVIVSEDHDLRNALIQGFVLKMVSPMTVGLPLLLLLLWLSIQRGLRPLASLRREVALRRPENLVPLDASAAPSEVRGVVEALNRLLKRVGHALDGERRFTANAAHELRTPLAALQAQLHLARHAANDAEREQAMQQLQLGVERGIRVVGQVLNLARLDPEQALPSPALVNLGEVAVNVCAALAPLALQRHQHLELDVEEGLPPSWGNADLLTMLLSNLVDNAIRYTPAEGRIWVTVRTVPQTSAAPGRIRLAVQDNGPGIPPAFRDKAFERFVRGNAPESEGTGLGLAICRRVAELHQAQVQLTDAPGGQGLLVTVDLPRASGE